MQRENPSIPHPFTTIGRFAGNWENELASLAPDTWRLAVMSKTYNRYWKRCGYETEHLELFRILCDVNESSIFGRMGREIAKRLLIESYLLRIQCQFPGQMVPAHRDLYEGFGSKYGVKPCEVFRFSIALSPQKFGHNFQFENPDGSGSHWEWNVGDIMYHPTTVKHCTSNTGFDPRYLLVITASCNDDAIKEKLRKMDLDLGTIEI